MTAADKLRELLATRPAKPSGHDLERWWQLGGDVILRLLADVEAIDCDLVAERAELRRERDARAQLRVELDRVQREKAELVSNLVCADRNRANDTTALAERDAEVVKLLPVYEAAKAWRLVDEQANPPPGSWKTFDVLREAVDAALDAERKRNAAALVNPHGHIADDLNVEHSIVTSGARPLCMNNSPAWFSGRWRDWHRGHGCDKDDGKPRTVEGAIEIERGGR